MDTENCVLLPHVLETLSEKAEFCDTYENLCNELKLVLSGETLQDREIEENLDRALSVGRDLGILTLTKDLIRMPFNYNNATKRPTKGVRNAAVLPEKYQMLMTTQPSRIQNDIPAIREHRRSRRNARRRSRKRISHRGRRRMSRRRSLSRRR